jgi:hypothetical protein
MSAGKMFLRPCGQGHELVAILQARSERAIERADRIDAALTPTRWVFDPKWSDRAYELLGKLFDRAHELNGRARRLLDMRPMPDFIVECAWCDEAHDIESTELVGAQRYCRGCAPIARAEAAEAYRSDEYDYHHDRGHGHDC